MKIHQNILRTSGVFKLTSYTALLLALAACGGGGGGSSSTTGTGGSGSGGSTGGSVGGTTVPADLITSGIASYAAGTVERGAFDELMRVRTTCGFGALNQNTLLDAEEAAHARYLGQNSADAVTTFYTGHNESNTLNYYTGATIQDRLTFQGYVTTQASEIITNNDAIYSSSSLPPITSNAAQGATSMRELVHSVYHLEGAMYEGREVGIGSYNVTWNYSTGLSAQAYRFGSISSLTGSAVTQKLGTGNVASYPCAGIASVRPNFAPATEAPNPLPSITNTATMVGTPIYFKADSGSVLSITGLTLTRVSNSTTVTTSQINSSNDPNSRLTANMIFAVPTSELAANESYRVQVTGTVDSTAFAKDFTFTTGAHE